MDITSFTLQNDLKVIYAKDNSNPLVCIQLYVRVGSAWEEENESGMSHFAEHMLFKSTDKFPDNSLSERITFLGGHINAYTEYDSTCFYVTIPSDFVAEGLEILSQLARYSNFSQQDFNSEKKVIIEEFKQFQNDPEDFFLEQIAADYFIHNPYKKPIIGDVDKLKNCSIDDVKNFYRKYYIPNNCYIVVTGNVEKPDLQREIDKYFGSWKEQDLNKRIPATESFPVKPVFKKIGKKNKQRYYGICITRPG